MTYLIPDRNRRIAGDTHACHINSAGQPLCGAELTEPYRASEWRYAYNTCAQCAQIERTGQRSLFA